VLKNLFIDEQRAQQREQFLMEQLSQQAQLMEQLRLNSHPMLQVLLQDLFDQIPERYRELLHKYYVLGMTNKEIADELGIPAATVRSRLHIALKKLRANKSRFL
jgi:RNA polymerase sigma-70 factor (ECF subfamily)